MPQKVDGKTWADSESRKQLYEDIIYGTVTNEMKPRHVRALRPEYQLWNQTNFGTNLASLRKIIARDYARAKRDTAAFNDDTKRVKALRALMTDVTTRWHTSAARKTLNAAIDDGIFDKPKKPTPVAMYNSESVYREFTLKEFRKHIYHELKRRERIKTNLRFVKKKYRMEQQKAHLDQLVTIQAKKKEPKKKKKPPKPPPPEIIAINAYAKPALKKTEATVSKRSNFGARSSRIKPTARQII